MAGKSFSKYQPRVHMTKSPKSRPKVANGRNPKVGSAKPYRKTWHRDPDWRNVRFKPSSNVIKWVCKHRGYTNVARKTI